MYSRRRRRQAGIGRSDRASHAGRNVGRARMHLRGRTRRWKHWTGCGPDVSRSARSGCWSACPTRARGSPSRTSLPESPAARPGRATRARRRSATCSCSPPRTTSTTPIVPRLVAAGADLDRVHIVKMMREAGKPRMFSLITDLGIAAAEGRRDRRGQDDRDRPDHRLSRHRQNRQLSRHRRARRARPVARSSPPSCGCWPRGACISTRRST